MTDLHCQKNPLLRRSREKMTKQIPRITRKITKKPEKYLKSLEKKQHAKHPRKILQLQHHAARLLRIDVADPRGRVQRHRRQRQVVEPRGPGGAGDQRRSAGPRRSAGFVYGLYGLYLQIKWFIFCISYYIYLDCCVCIIYIYMDYPWMILRNGEFAYGVHIY